MENEQKFEVMDLSVDRHMADVRNSLVEKVKGCERDLFITLSQTRIDF